jgi:PknH-like extracellular domain
VRQRLAVLLLAGVSALTAGCTTEVSGKAVPADTSGPLPQTPVAVTALDGLLLDASQINDAMNATSMKVGFNATAMWDWSSGVSDTNCLAVDGPAQDKVYAGTGWTAMRGQRLDDSVDDSKKRNQYAIQAVVAYPSARDANAFYDSSSVSQVQEGGKGWGCQRALTVRNNVAIDAVTCAFTQAGSSTVTIAEQIAAKVARQ